MNPISRRRFVGCSLAGTAGLSLGLGGDLLARQSRGQPPLRWGVIGTGHRARVAHIPAIREMEDMEIVAACDVRAPHLSAAMAEIDGKATAYRDWQKLLADPDVDAVMICTPNLLHGEMLRAALEAGKHVMCEKPMATTLEECRAMEAAAAASDRVVLYTMQLRYSPTFQELRRHIEAGRIGRARYIDFLESRGDWNQGDVWRYVDPATGRTMNWRLSQRATGGTLNEKVCHYFDIIHWMVGDVPRRVHCAGGVSVYEDGRETWDHAATVLEFEDGIKASHSLSMFGPKRKDFQIIGDEGGLLVMPDHLLLQERGDPTTHRLDLPPELRHGVRGAGTETAVLRMYRDFADCVATGTRPWMSGDKAMASSRVAWLGELSSREGRAVEWEELG